jgi:hypothetical protein
MVEERVVETNESLLVGFFFFFLKSSGNGARPSESRRNPFRISLRKLSSTSKKS